jgi:capsular exopolysaccharide synthesis family protein
MGQPVDVAMRPRAGLAVEAERAVHKPIYEPVHEPIDEPRPGGLCRTPRASRSARGAWARLLIHQAAAPAIVEQYRMLRTSLNQRRNGHPPRTVLVTSAAQAEGKSTVAVNLAVAIAQSVRAHALLVDCNLRRPSLHGLFGLGPRTGGLSEYLRGEAGLSGLLLATGVPKLTLLPAGAAAPDATELLDSEAMRSLLTELRGRYPDRMIVLDSPAVAEAADASILAPQAEAVLLVVRSGRTDRETIIRAMENVGQERVVGVVFNAAGRAA